MDSDKKFRSELQIIDLELFCNPTVSFVHFGSMCRKTLFWHSESFYHRRSGSPRNMAS